MKIEKKEYRGLPYEEVDNFYVRMDKIDFDLMTRYFDAVQKNAEASSKLFEVLEEKIEALTEQNGALKTMLMMKESKEKEEVFCPTNDISCPYNAEGLCTMEKPWNNCDDAIAIYCGTVGNEDEEQVGKMKEKLAEYLKYEIVYLEKVLDGEEDIIERDNMCWYAKQRGLGACTFAMAIVSARERTEIEAMYEDYCWKLEEMEKLQ